ncbi:MAG: hypothetical protein GVY13_07910 [Alphaproteobacteria bacterium]|jgi:mRNA-degrading endonuclease YafQ of YafQ-DinJ toxin-antitoxin module|nr:hypothetical protein [Alphaproteobacteria bacterium]
MRRLRKLSREDKQAVELAIEQFREDPFSPGLQNHELSGPLGGRRAISVDHDLRIIFIEKDNYKEVTLLDIGPHSTVYKG